MPEAATPDDRAARQPRLSPIAGSPGERRLIVRALFPELSEEEVAWVAANFDMACDSPVFEYDDGSSVRRVAVVARKVDVTAPLVRTFGADTVSIIHSMDRTPPIMQGRPPAGPRDIARYATVEDPGYRARLRSARLAEAMATIDLAPVQPNAYGPLETAGLNHIASSSPDLILVMPSVPVTWKSSAE